MSRAYWVESKHEGSCVECNAEELCMDVDTGAVPNVRVLKVEMGRGVNQVGRLCRRHAQELINNLLVAMGDLTAKEPLRGTS